MPKEPLSVSVIIPTHNRPQFLPDAMESVRRQSARPAELIVVDDMGVDSTRWIVEGFSAPFPVRYVHNDSHPGAPASRNLGAALSKGDLLAFLDDDDWWLEDYLDACVRQMRDNPSLDFVVAWCLKTDGKTTWGSMTMEDGLSASSAATTNPGFSGQNFVIRRPAFFEVSGFDPKAPMLQDRELFVRLMRHGCNYAVIRQRLVVLRVHGTERITSRRTRRRYLAVRYFRKKHGGLFTRRQRLELRLEEHRARGSPEFSAPARLWSFLAVKAIQFALYRMRCFGDR